jgi:hypothetical protein
LFSGGTSDRFKDFCNVSHSSTSPAGQEIEHLEQHPENENEELRKVKLMDFISRLRGHLDVSHINLPVFGERKNYNSTLINQKLRRAILLRSLLEQHAPSIFASAKGGEGKIARIQDDVVKTFLNAPKYEHGVRSMEAIIQMSRWIEDHFVMASFPSEFLLKSHVDSTE